MSVRRRDNRCLRIIIVKVVRKLIFDTSNYLLENVIIIYISFEKDGWINGSQKRKSLNFQNKITNIGKFPEYGSNIIKKRDWLYISGSTRNSQLKIVC